MSIIAAQDAVRFSSILYRALPSWHVRMPLSMPLPDITRAMQICVACLRGHTIKAWSVSERSSRERGQSSSLCLAGRRLELLITENSCVCKVSNHRI